MTSQGDDGGGFTIVGEKNVRRVAWVSTAHAAALEINTGLKMRHGWSAVAACNKISGGTGRTKKKALQDLLTFLYLDHGYRPRANEGVHLASGWITVDLHVVNTYQSEGRKSTERTTFVREFKEQVIPPPPRWTTEAYGEQLARLEEWSWIWIYGFTGEGEAYSDVQSWHDVTITGSSDPALIGMQYEFGY